MMESLETEVLESYFGPYSPSAKSYGGKRCFLSWCCKVFVGCGLCQSTTVLYAQTEGRFCNRYIWRLEVQLGYITSVALREQLCGVQNGKPMKLIFARWLTVLCPTRVVDAWWKASRKEKGQSSQAQPKESVRRTIPWEEWQEELETEIHHQPDTQVLEPKPNQQHTTGSRLTTRRNNDTTVGRRRSTTTDIPINGEGERISTTGKKKMTIGGTRPTTKKDEAVS